MTTQHRWLPVTPEAIRKQQFSPGRWGRRSYAAEEVDRLLDRLASDASQSIEIITWLRAELERLKDYIRNTDLSPAELQTRQAHHEAVTLLARAQRQADQLIASAQDQARRMVQDAQGQRDHMLQEAQQEADQAARAYRDSAGPHYSPEVEKAVRQLTFMRTLMAAINTVRAQLPAILQQLDAVGGAFDHELATVEDQLNHARQIAAAGETGYHGSAHVSAAPGGG